MTRSVYTGLCLTAAMAFAGSADAQTARGSKGATGRTTTAVGCLEPGTQANSFVLSVLEETAAAQAGSRLLLTSADRADAQDHIGQKVEVLGTLMPQRQTDPAAVRRMAVRHIRPLAPNCGPGAARTTQPGQRVPATAATTTAASAPVAMTAAATAGVTAPEPPVAVTGAPSGVTSTTGAPSGVTSSMGVTGSLAQTGVSGDAVLTGGATGGATATAAPAAITTAAVPTAPTTVTSPGPSAPVTTAATAAVTATPTTTAPTTTAAPTAAMTAMPTATTAAPTTTVDPAATNPTTTATTTPAPGQVTGDPAFSQGAVATVTTTGTLDQVGVSGSALLSGLVNVNVQQALAAVQAQASVTVQDVIVNVSNVANDLQVQALVQALNTNPQASMNATEMTSALQSAGLIDPGQFVVGVTGTEIYNNRDLTNALQQRGIISPSETIMTTIPARIYVAQP